MISKTTLEKIFEYASMPVHGTLSRKLRKGIRLQVNEGAVYEGTTLFLGEEFIRITFYTYSGLTILLLVLVHFLPETRNRSFHTDEDEEKEFKKNEAIRQAAEFNDKYPIGTKVLFQADGRDKPIVTTTRSKAEVYADYLIIFLEGVSGSYSFDDRFVRVLTEDNKNLERLR